jgi:hypothetical protein
MKARICGAAFWTPGTWGLPALASGTRSEGFEKPKASLLPSRLRRRTALLTKAVSDVVEDAARQGAVDLAQARLVLASAWGELDTTVQLLAQLATDPAQVSPTLFHNSVHNTATGYLSIVLENREGSSAIGAGQDSLAAGLIEAATLVETEGGEAILVVGDEPVPTPFDESPGDPVALALCLRPVDGAPGGELDVLCRIEFGDYAECTVNDLDVPAALAGNPSRSVVPLAKAIARNGPNRVPLSLGRTEGWFIELQPQEGV